MNDINFTLCPNFDRITRLKEDIHKEFLPREVSELRWKEGQQAMGEVKKLADNLVSMHEEALEAKAEIKRIQEKYHEDKMSAEKKSQFWNQIRIGLVVTVGASVIIGIWAFYHKVSNLMSHLPPFPLYH